MTQDIAIFKAMSAKMGYLDMRQKVLAQNVANADTPNYRAKDLTEVDFGSVLKDITSGERLNVRLETTQKGHMPDPNNVQDGEVKKRAVTYEVAPAGNAVILEEEIIKANQNSVDYSMITNLYTKHMSMMRTAIGRGQ